MNLYGFCFNNGVNAWDVLGMGVDGAGLYDIHQLDGGGGRDNLGFDTSGGRSAPTVNNPTGDQRDAMDAASRLQAAIATLAQTIEVRSGFAISSDEATAAAAQAIGIYAAGPSDSMLFQVVSNTPGVAPRSVNAASSSSVSATSPQGVSQADGSIDFQKGKSYLVVYSGKEQGRNNVSDITSYEKNSAHFDYKLKGLNVDENTTKSGWGDYVKNALGSATFDGIFFSQHGGLAGPVNRTVANLFQNHLAPALSAYLNQGGYIALMQCRGVFAPGFISSIQASFGGAPVYSAGGYNSMTYVGIVSYLPVDPTTDDGKAYSNRYSRWGKP